MKSQLAILFLLLVPVFAEPGKSPNLDRKMERYIEKTLRPVIDQVRDATLPYTEINKRIRQQDELLGQKYPGKKLAVRMSFGYHPSDRNIAAMSDLLPDGTPWIAVYVPVVMHFDGENVGAIARDILHERDHLVEESGMVGNLECEIHVQAVTTQFVIVPLKEVYGVPLTERDQRYYDSWLHSHRREESWIWRDRVQKEYSRILKK